MHAKIFSVLLLQGLFNALLVQATIYIVNPLPGSICHGGKPCTVEWLDDGVVPLLSQINACHVALYNGDQKLIQGIDPVDVSAQHSLQFTPDPSAGPNSEAYYLNFTSVNPIGNEPYFQFSTMFTIDSMTGSFDSPVPSDTGTIPVPSSLTSSKPVSSTTTTTIRPTDTTTNSASTSASTSPTTSNTSTSITSTPTTTPSFSSPSPSSSSPSSSEPISTDPTTTSTSTNSSTQQTVSGEPTDVPTTTLFVSALSGLASNNLGTTLITTTSTSTAPPTVPTAPDSSASDVPTTNQSSACVRFASIPGLVAVSSVVTFAAALLI